MKANVTMLSKDRELFGVTIKQQTKNSFISISDLQAAYEVARWQHGWSDRKVNHILSNESTKERIYYLLLERGLVKAEFSAFIKMTEDEGIVKVLKGLEVWKTTGKGSNKSVYCDPYIWVLIAMELNPILYAKVVMWLTDSLIFDRIEAGSGYRPMNIAINKIVTKPDYAKYAMLINQNVFGSNQSGMRQLASAEQLKKISKIEEFITQGIEMGMITQEQGIEKAIKLFK